MTLLCFIIHLNNLLAWTASCAVSFYILPYIHLATPTVPCFMVSSKLAWLLSLVCRYYLSRFSEQKWQYSGSRIMWSLVWDHCHPQCYLWVFIVQQFSGKPSENNQLQPIVYLNACLLVKNQVTFSYLLYTHRCVSLINFFLSGW